MYLLFDIGGTQMRLAVSYTGKQLDEVQAVKTPATFEQGMVAFEQLCMKLTAEKKITAVVGGVAGVLDSRQGKLLASPNLKGWISKPLKKKIEKITRSKVSVGNDADLAGVGEANFGAGKGKRIVAYITVSTGIGGGRIINGELDISAFGFEPGHQLLIVDKKPRDFEELASGTAILRRYGKYFSEITDKKILNQERQYLAYGLHNIILLWSPDIVVLGGGVSLTQKIKISEIKQQLQKTLGQYGMPQLKKATLGDYSGLFGALHLAKSKKR